MANRNGIHSLPSRPPLTSHQSNSVPSTPHQHAREFRSRSRSPSPHAGLGLGSHSPRSVTSEANGTMTTLPRGRPTCKYETSAAFSRRRMQYDIGDAPLETPKEEPKKALDPNEEKKLSGDMRELYDRLLPSEESEKRRITFVEKLEGILRKQWPDTEFNVHIFGSSGNMLCTNDSDVDICIQTPMKKLETMHMLAEVLANNGMERVVCIAAAKVPIVKMWDPELKLAADINVNNTLALENTRMIKTYVQIDERVRPLAMTVKHWTKQRILNDAGIGGTLSSYTWICMVINFLQTRDPPILPVLHQLPHKEYKAQDGTESGFNDDLDNLLGRGSANKETIGELLFYFFRLYAHDFDYEKSVVSVRHGKVLTRREKSWDMASGSKEGQWRLCVEEPFNTTRNLGNSADSTAFRGIHLELRQAFDLLADGGQLEKACQEYVFPPEEKVTFVKPVSGPKPILSAIPMQPARNGRGGGNMRGGRHNNGQRNGTQYRRSSSGAAFGARQYPPFIASPPLGMVGADYMSQLDAAMIQDQLFQQSQANWQQIEQLKAKMAYQHHRIQAAEHARSVVQGSGQTSQSQSATASPQKAPFLSRGSSPQMSSSSLAYPDFMYNGQFFDPQGLASAQSQDGTRTNPSSPSLSHSVPSRRTPQRSTLASDQGAAMRSQSQPARGMQQSFMVHGYPPFALPAYAMSQYPTGPPRKDNLQSHSSVEGGAEVPVGYDPLYRTSSLPLGPPDSTPKEYLGYYMHDPRNAQMPATNQTQQMPVFGTLPQIPQYSELAHRRNRPSQDLHLTLNGFKHMSRSPSPLSHHRTFSTPVRPGVPPLHSAPLDKVVGRFDRIDSSHVPSRGQVPAPSGLLIVNGSSYPDTTTSSVEDDSSTSALDDPVASYSDRSDIFPPEEIFPLGSQQHVQVNHLQSEFYPRNGMPYQPFQPEPENTRQLYPSPPQAFPPYIEPGAPMSRSATAKDDDQILLPKSAPWASNLHTKPSISPIDTSPSVQAAGKNEPKTAPLLSPVYETRSPSPTAQRRPDNVRQSTLNGVLPIMNGNRTKENGVPNGKLSGPKSEPPPPTPASKSSSTNPLNGDRQGRAPTSNGTSSGGNHWQPARKNKNRKRSKSGPNPKTGSSSKEHGEPLPKIETERKGG